MTWAGRDAESALTQRLLAVHEAVAPHRTGGVETLTGVDLLVELVSQVRLRGDAAAWLLVVGMTAAFPDAGTVRSVRRSLELRQPEDGAVWLLDALTQLAVRDGDAGAVLRIVTDRPLVDVTFTAVSGVLTGIQRVVRGVVAQWHERHDVEFVAWTDRGGGYRSLVPDELARLTGVESVRSGEDRSAQHEIIVPWGVPVAVAEVPSRTHSDRLAAIAELTDVSVRLVGYDCIPVSSAEMVPVAEPEKFGRYLELVKHSDRLAAISRTAAEEFGGHVRALKAQGLAGPRITACPLPHTSTIGDDPAPGRDAREETAGRPLVMCVGSIGRRKNQSTIVEAAELLWREGLEFELRLLGHVSPERTPLTALVPELQELGRPLVLESKVSDARIAETLAEARCLVFPSLHEGFGLPVVEALSHDVPVITSDFGSLREVAEGQGGLLVDPEDVDALADAMRSLLVDDELHARLVAEARARPVRTWVEYADELWEVLLS